MFDFMTITRALADESRVRILMSLRKRELCVCQITGLLDLAPSTTSRHLNILRQARLIESKKRGKWVYYYLPENSLLAVESSLFPTNLGEKAEKNSSFASASMVGLAINFVSASLMHSPEILADESRINEILSAEEERFCLNGLEGADMEMWHSPEIHIMEEIDFAKK